MSNSLIADRRSHARLALALTLCALTSTARAHTGHGADSLLAGLAHPLGPDHLLAMVAVGVWSVFALPPGRSWMGPATFMLALVFSAALGASGVTLPYLEHAISASVLLFGIMLVMATRRVALGWGLGLIAGAAALHGLAHGAEAPGSASFLAYAAGFLATTALLHAGGVVGGLALRRRFAQQAPRVLAGLGLVLSSAGAYLLSVV